MFWKSQKKEGKREIIFIAYGSACLGFALNMEDDQKKDRAKGS